MKKLFLSRHLYPALLIVIILLFFVPNLLSGKIPFPADSLLGLYHPWRDNSFDGFNPEKFPVKNPIVTDPVLQTYPWRSRVIENIKEGLLPLWNPYYFSGQPLFANIQSSPLQIFNLFYLIIPFNISWSVTIILPIITSALFLYYFLTKLKISNFSATVGSLAFSFSGFFVAWMMWGTVVTTAMWLPLILLCLKLLSEKLQPFIFLVLIFAISQSIFSGHLQIAFYQITAAFLFALYLFRQTKNLNFLIFTGLAFVLSLAVSAVQLMPFTELITHSARSTDQVYFLGKQDWFLPLQNLMQLIAPDFFGNPTKYNYWGVWNYGEFVSYIGILPLTFAVFSLFKRKKTSFFIFLGIISLFFAISNPISKLIYISDVPLLSSAQPSRIIFLLVFALSILSSFGLDYFFKQKFKKKLLIPSLVIIFLASVLSLYSIFTVKNYITQEEINIFRIITRNSLLPLVLIIAVTGIILLKKFKINQKIIYATIILITMFELFWFSSRYLTFSKLTLIFPKTKTTDFLSLQERPFRILSTDRRIFTANTPTAYKIESVAGYDPLYLKDYATFVSSWETDTKTEAGSFNRIITPQNFSSNITNLMNVKYIITFDDIDNPRFNLVSEEGKTKVYENLEFIPRFFFVDEIIKTKNPEETLGRIFDKNIDLSKTAFSEKISFDNQEVDSQIKILKYNDQSVSLETTLNKSAPLISSNVHYPGWKLLVDDKEWDLQKVNFMFQGAIIPAGEHKLEFIFKPKSFYNGLYISAAGVLSSLLVAVYIWRKRFQ